jgi:hypothetical protein
MYALVYSSSDTDDDSTPTKRPFTICPKCGRFIKIDGHCECEAIFFDMVINAIKNK